MTFKSTTEIEKYINLAEAKGIPRQIMVDVFANYAHSFSKDSIGLLVSTTTVNHSKNPNFQLHACKEKIVFTTNKDLKAGEELLFDYRTFIMPDFYVNEFCPANSITDVRTVMMNLNWSNRSLGAELWHKNAVDRLSYA